MFISFHSKTMGATSVIEIAYTFGATAFLLFIGFLTPTCKYCIHTQEGILGLYPLDLAYVFVFCILDLVDSDR